MKISELYGMRIYTTDKKKSGYVLGACCEGNKIKFLLCSDESEREFLVDADKITHVDECITYEDGKQKITKLNVIRLGRGSYSESGKYLGILSDLELNNFAIKNAIIGRKKYNFNRLVMGDINIVKSSEKDKSFASLPHELFIQTLCN
jgi:hypothetical protein